MKLRTHIKDGTFPRTLRYNVGANITINILTIGSKFGVVFFVSKSLLGIERQTKLKKFAILTQKALSHVRILIYRMWPIQERNRLDKRLTKKG